MVFFSNYDGTVESYMDDFINKTGFGLNAAFSNGIGYPRTNTKFSGLTEENDPLLGHDETAPGCPITRDFTRPRDGTLRQRRSGLPQFVTVRGGAYFFLPSLRVLRYFAAA